MVLSLGFNNKLSLGFNSKVMIHKYLFYFISWFNIKISIQIVTNEFCFVASSAFIGCTLAVGIYAIVNVISIVFLRSNGVYIILSTIMDYLCLVAILLSYLYFSHNGRWNVIFNEIHLEPHSQKIKFGIYCLLYVLSVFGLWFFSNDVIRVLNTGDGTFCAMKIVEILNLTSW